MASSDFCQDLNFIRHSQRSKESHDLSEKYILRTFSVGYFAYAQYDTFLSPIVGVADTSPTRRTRPFCRYRDISPVSAGEFTPKEEARIYFKSAVKLARSSSNALSACALSLPFTE